MRPWYWTLRIVCVWGALAFVLFSPIVEAADFIRVALIQDASRIQISSPHTLYLRFPSGKPMTRHVSMTVSPAGGRLRINGKLIPSGMVRVQSRRGEVELWIKDRGPGNGRSKESAKWKVSGGLDIHNQDGTLLVINRVDLEAYVAGVVGSEINRDWHPEVLKAQATAARTYVLHKKMLNREQEFDVVASVQDQVYTGQTHINSAIREAVEDTSGRVVTYNGRPIFAAYSSTAAGPTEDASNVWSFNLPYLKGVDCPFDENSPRYQWRAVLELATVERQLRKNGFSVGTLATLTPYKFTRAGRVNAIRILHSRGELILRGQDFRRAIGYTTIPSTQFSIESFGQEMVLSGKGAGHAVGLCQWGAKEMAELGYRYESILLYYYPGTELMDRPAVNMTPPDLP